MVENVRRALGDERSKLIKNHARTAWRLDLSYRRLHRRTVYTRPREDGTANEEAETDRVHERVNGEHFCMLEYVVHASHVAAQTHEPLAVDALHPPQQAFRHTEMAECGHLSVALREGNRNTYSRHSHDEPGPSASKRHE